MMLVIPMLRVFFFPFSPFVQDIVPVDASYEVKELYVQENKLDLAKADAETLPAVHIAKVSTYFFSLKFL